MRNRFITVFMTLLTVFAFSGLASAQDPIGNTDSIWLDCGTNVYPGAGTTTVTLTVMGFSDNVGDEIAAIEIPLLISGANIVSIDTTVAASFAGSSFTDPPFSNRAATKQVNADPTVIPANMSYGAVTFGGVGVAGLMTLCKIVLTVDDTGQICVDTTHNEVTTLPPNFTTEQAFGYVVEWPDTLPQCCDVTPYVNQNPTVSCGPNREAFAGGTFDHAVIASDPDDPNNICDEITDATFQFLDSTFVPIGGPDVAPCGVATLDETGLPAEGGASAQFNWNTTGCAGGTYYVVFTFTDECGGSGADTCCYTIKTACAFVTIGEVTGDPCQTVELPVYLNASGDDIGGFNFCIEFANADLTVISVRRGELIDDVDPQHNNKYRWHYFTYRLNPSTVIHKYKVCVIGIGQVYSAYPGMCIEQGSNGVLFYIKFVLACNELFRCHDTHVYFEWDDWTCLENTLSDCTGNLLYVSDNPLYYDPEECGLGEKNEVIRCVNFGNGRVIWRCPEDVDPVVRGDINVNGFPYEIADAVLFARYFVEGLSVFSSDYDTRQAQVGATDINGDGYTLSVADLVYLLRILVGDQAPLGAATAPDAIATVDFNGHKLVLNSPEALGAIVLTFKGEGKLVPMVEGFEVKQFSANGETKAIIYTMTKGKGIENGELFAVSGTLTPVSVEAATYNAAPINVEVTGRTLPKEFSLSQSYPNPFNATTQINFALPSAGEVSLKVYNVAGQLVKSFNQHMEAGYRTITWDGTNSKGDAVASGVYFYRLDVGNQFSKTLKMTLLK